MTTFLETLAGPPGTILWRFVLFSISFWIAVTCFAIMLFRAVNARMQKRRCERNYHVVGHNARAVEFRNNLPVVHCDCCGKKIIPAIEWEFLSYSGRWIELENSHDGVE